MSVNVYYEAALSTFIAIRTSLVFPFLHACWVAYSFRSANGGKSVVSFKGAVTQIILGLGGGIMAALLAGRPVSILVSNYLLGIYLLGYWLINATPVYTLIVKSAPVSEIVLECYVDGLLRAFALTAYIDDFKLFSAESLAGQWLIGVISCSAGGILYKTVSSNNWELDDKVTILASASALYVYFINKTQMHLFGYMMHQDDVKFFISAFIIAFFMIARILKEQEQTKTVEKMDVASKEPESEFSLEQEKITPPGSPSKKESPKKSPVKPLSQSPKREKRSPVKSSSETAADSQLPGTTDDEKPVLRRRTTRARKPKSSVVDA